ncbi:MAG: homogentisate phytyltransferase [Cyanobium sp.]|jgi:homogentisate phytyltransferase/homogentisate geranylgeranyltransferase
MNPSAPFATQSWPAALWAFSRPHTIWGTLLSVIALGVLAFVLPPASPLAAAGIDPLRCLALVAAALLPALAANVFIVGLNQLTDVAIDRINKPQLPLASGRFSQRQGQSIVAITAVAALLLAAMQGPVLFTTVAVSMAIGTAYSCRPLRLKRFPFWAALCIVGVRGVVVNVGFFSHFRTAFSPAAAAILPPEVIALSAFVMIFTLAIALFKDIPDLRGDRQHRIFTLTVRLGPSLVFSLCRWILTASYGLMILLALSGALPSIHRGFLALSQLLLLTVMWIRSLAVNVWHDEQTKAFYRLIWKLFFLEYLLFPVAALVA